MKEEVLQAVWGCPDHPGYPVLKNITFCLGLTLTMQLAVTETKHSLAFNRIR